jgi:two-component system LytT family response regulator
MINCIIIEDEPLAQNGLINLIKPYPTLSVLSVCDDIEDFLLFQKTNPDKTIDLIFLDIELPGLNGINFLRRTKQQIPVVFTTAYNEFAMEGYELNVLDYLLKPISKTRFHKTVEKAENYIHFLKLKGDSNQDFIYIKSDKVIEKVFCNEIILIEAMRNYVIYHCDKRKLVSYNALKNVEQSLNAGQFIKIQKSFIINKNKVERIEKGSVFIHSRHIAINRENRNAIIKRLTEN